MREIDKVLEQIEGCIKNKSYKPFETDRFELKDLSSGQDWQELYKSVNAFLNTKGGIIVIGIKEDTKNKQFKFTGFRQTNESKLKELPKMFADSKGNFVDLSNYIPLNCIEIKPFLEGQVALVFVEKLPDEEKFIYYKGEAYERQITGDHKISKEKIQKQEEYKKTIQNATELEIVPNATLEDLDIDKLNEYIHRLNRDVKIETLKTDLQNALPFLVRKRFVRNNQPTLLGMLVCAKHPYDYLGGKAEIDAYFEIGSNIADDKKIFRNNIIDLMESAWAFVFSKINIGISPDKGGSEIYEYPEIIIRETINNALAHRDYRSEGFSVIRIKNKEFIEIKNPGKFQEVQIIHSNKPKLRRIIPFPNRQNPNLTDILKDYNRYEGRGIGMATLINFALANQIDVPYYIIHPNNELSLFLISGKVLDSKAMQWLNSFEKYILKKTKGLELNEQQKTILAYFYKSEKYNENEKYTINLSPDNNHFAVIRELVEWGLLKEISTSREVPLYQIDETLKKDNFIEELRKIFGGAFDELSSDAKEVLQAVYQQSLYGTTNRISASLIGDFLYFRKHNPKNIDLRDYGNFKRKVRSIISKLKNKKLIVEKDKNDYCINEHFERKKSIFD
jgi:predicted HTH transcriptional regulator